MWVLFLFLMTGLARADVYVITASDKSVYSLSEQDDAVMPKGYIKTIIKGTINLLPISGDPTLYDFNSGSFTLNATRVKNKNAIIQADILSEQAKADAKASALAKLTDAITKVNPSDVLTNQEVQAILGE